MITHKKKICKKCKKPSYYWTVGLCKNCSPKKKYVYKRKSIGEKKLFKTIWKEREHQCVNCKKKLPGSLKPIYFSHIIPKGRDKSKRLDPNNIQILCGDCHYAFDFRGREVFDKRKK